MTFYFETYGEGEPLLLIHGNGGCTAADGWLPFVERDLRALGLDVVNETFPDNDRARAIAPLYLPAQWAKGLLLGQLN